MGRGIRAGRSADGSQYVVSLDGKPWLHSGTLRLFVNGEWHGLVTTAPPTPTPICGPGKQGMDVAAGHVYVGRACVETTCSIRWLVL